MIDVTLMQFGFNQILSQEFFSYILPWLLTFAIVYGILSQISVPESKSARSIIGIVLAFIVAPALGKYVISLMRFSSGIIILVSGFLVLVVLLEIFGIRLPKKEKVTVEGEEKEVPVPKTIFEAYPKFFAVVIAILAILIFFGSGAAQAMGIKIPSWTLNTPLLFFLGVMVILVWWMISE